MMSPSATASTNSGLTLRSLPQAQIETERETERETETERDDEPLR